MFSITKLTIHIFRLNYYTYLCNALIWTHTYDTEGIGIALTYLWRFYENIL